MKKSRTFMHHLILLILIAAVAACGSTSKQESTWEYVDDSVVTAKIKSLLAADHFLKSFQIDVETYKGTVQLSGFVNSQQAVDKAGEIVRSVKGVKSVACTLFDSQVGFPVEFQRYATTIMIIAIQDAQARGDFSDILSETSVLSVIHDENLDGKLDTNWLEIPTEGYEFSNDEKAMRRPPLFPGVRLPYDGQDKELRVSLLY